MSVVGGRRDPNPPYPAHAQPHHTTLTCRNIVYQTAPYYIILGAFTTPYPQDTHYTCDILYYTRPYCFHTAQCHHTLGTSALSSTEHCKQPALLQKTGGMGLQRKTHKTHYYSRVGADNRISVWLYRGVQLGHTSPRGLLPGPPPPTKCPQFFAHQSQYSDIVQCCRTMHRSQHFVCPLSRRRDAPAATERGQKLRRPCYAMKHSQTFPISAFSDSLIQS